MTYDGFFSEDQPLLGLLIAIEYAEEQNQCLAVFDRWSAWELSDQGVMSGAERCLKCKRQLIFLKSRS